MDEFTEKLLERSKARKEFLKNKKTPEMRKRRTVLVDENQITSPNTDLQEQNDDSPKRQCLEADGLCYNGQKTLENKENSKRESDNELTFFPYVAAGARGLAALRKNKIPSDETEVKETLSYNGTESKECQGFVKSPSKAKISYDFSKRVEAQKSTTKSSSEDSSNDEMDDDHIESFGSSRSSPMKESSPMDCEILPKVENLPKPSGNRSANKKVDLGIEEKQYNADPAELPLSARKAIFEKAFFGTPSKQDNSVESNMSVAQRAAMFEKAAKGSPRKIQKEPCKLPTSANIPPKPTSILQEPSKCPPPATVPSKVVYSSQPKSPAKVVTVPNAVNRNPGKECIVSPLKSPTAMEVKVLSPSKNASPHTRLVQQRLIESSAGDWKKKDAIAKAADDRKKEIAALVNHWEKVSTSSEKSPNIDHHPYPSSSSTSSEADRYRPVFDKENDENGDDSKSESSSGDEGENEDYQDNDEVSDEDESPTDTESNFEMSSSAPCEEDYVISRRYRSMSEKAASEAAKNAASICSNIKVVDEVLEPEVKHMPPPPMPSSRSQFSKSTSISSTSSGSSSSQKGSSQSQYSTPTLNYDYTDADMPLLHTVSFYRKQKQEKRTTPVRTIVRREQVTSPPSPEVDSVKLIQAKIKALEEEILSHQTVISQTSQALNLCHATEEFFGSTEQVEGERLLLIATQKRQACLNEIHRLKTHGAMGKSVETGSGSLIMHDIKLPLKRDFIACQLENKDNDAVHYFLCLVRHGHQVIVTQMLSTTPQEITNGSLCFTNHITLHDLPPDFSIVFEVYALQTKKEVLPHEKKYHIKKEHSKIRLTPKGKKSDSKLLMPAVSSPGGPSAVRTPSFGVVGYTRFTLQNCNRKTYTLDKVPFSSPLDGVLLVKLQLHSEHNVQEKGFLTMYEDVSGKGALRRLWCVLDGRELSFWKYPDDERRKNPIHQIDLSQCITSHVKLLSRDICARPHTFQLLTARPQAEGDKNTLISRKVNTLTTTKYTLSADTKEERIMWCKRLNESLTNVRKWDPNALRPIEMKE